MQRKTMKLVSVMLVMALALSFATAASAATIMYATQDVNVRSGPGTGYAAIGSLDKGDSITATGYSINGWTQVQYSTYEQGYVINSALSYYRPSSSSSSAGHTGSFSVCTDCGDTYYATTALNVRSGPGTNYSIIGSLSRNQQVTRIGKSGNWYKLLTSNGVSAYASASYLKPVGSSSGSSSSSSGNSYVSYGTYYTTTGLNVRKGPSTGYSVIDTLRRGEAVTYLGERDGKWLKVRTSSGLAGWCHGSYLTAAGSSGSVSSGGTVCIPSSYCGYCNRLYYGNSCTYCYNGWYWNTGVYNPYTKVKLGWNYCVFGDVDLYNTSRGTVELLDGTSVKILGLSMGSNMARVEVSHCKNRQNVGLVGDIYITDLRY